MTEKSSDQLIDSLLRPDIVGPDATPYLDLLRTEFTDPDGLAGELVRRRWLTEFQADRLLGGREDELVLGHYALLELLGQGGMGRVYKARHRLMNRLVALKVIRAELLDVGESRQRFLREIEAAARVWHPNLVTAHDAAAVGGNFLLVMEYVEGTTLARRLADDGPSPIRHACDWVRQAALGLHHAHEQGLIHRDVKPSNLLLLARENTVKVLDLGLARLDIDAADGSGDGPITASGVVIGTPDYMAPEQALSPHEVDRRADVYGLGCTLYHLLTGRPPYPGGTLTQKLLWHQQAEVPDPSRLRPSLPPGLAGTVTRMLSKSPDARPATAAEVADLLAHFCSASHLKTLPVPETPQSVEFKAGHGSHGNSTVVRHEPAGEGTYDLIPDESGAQEPADEPGPPPPVEGPADNLPPLPRPAVAGDESWWRDELQAERRPPSRPPARPAPAPPPARGVSGGWLWLSFATCIVLLAAAAWRLALAFR